MADAEVGKVLAGHRQRLIGQHLGRQTQEVVDKRKDALVGRFRSAIRTNHEFGKDSVVGAVQQLVNEQYANGAAPSDLGKIYRQAVTEEAINLNDDEIAGDIFNGVLGPDGKKIDEAFTPDDLQQATKAISAKRMWEMDNAERLERQADQKAYEDVMTEFRKQWKSGMNPFDVKVDVTKLSPEVQ